MKKKTIAIIGGIVVAGVIGMFLPKQDTPKAPDVPQVAAQSESKAPESKQASPIDGLTFVRRDVINDSTGKWKLSTISEIIPTEELVPAYYDQYMKDAESGAVHWIVNYASKTVTRISDLGGVVDVVTTEYSEDEEHDASTLGNGLQLTEHHFTPSTGVMEEI